MEKRTIPEVILERFVLEELPANKMEEIRALAESDRVLARRIANLRKSNGAVMKEYPPETIAAEIGRRYRIALSEEQARTARNRKKVLVLAPSFAAAAAVLFFLLPVFRGPADVGDPGEGGLEQTRLKGLEAGLVIYRKGGASAEVLAEGASVREKDLLQIGYVSPESAYGVILSIDGNGTVTVHHPKNGEAARIVAGRKVMLPRSYELDDAPGFERFFFVTSKKNFRLQTVVDSARRLARDPKRAATERLSLDGSFEQHILMLKKGK